MFTAPEMRTRRAKRAAVSESARKWRADNSELRRALELRRNYGITIAQYDRMFLRQGGLCAVCGRPPKTKRLSVDHDHGPTKRVRGLACHTCNQYRIGKNTAATARLVLAYLESDFDGRAI